MLNRNVYNSYNLSDINYRSTLLNRITVNKKAAANNNKNLRLLNYNRSTDKNRNYKDFVYYENENKNKNKRNKLSEEKMNTKKDIYYNNRDSYKKTINTYSNDTKIKDRNIFEELQNNKYLRPMLGTTNINKKLLKCKIEEPIKNICTLSLKNYFSNIDLPFQKCQSPQKENIVDEDNIFSYNLNNRTVMDRFNINTNNEYSPLNEKKLFEVKKNSNSFMYKGDSYNFNNYLIRYSVNNIKKYSTSKIDRDRDRERDRKTKNKNYYCKKNKEKVKKYLNKKSPTIYHKNAIGLRAPFNGKKKNNITTKKIYNISLINNMQRDKLLLKIYQNKLVEEFVVIINKVFMKYYKKKRKCFLNNLINFKKKTTIYFKKKNSRQNIKNISLIDKKKDQILLVNIQKNKTNIINESINNSNSKSFSNEFKPPSLTNNFRTNNNNINYQNKSYILSEHKSKRYYNQSPDNSLNKYQQLNIRKKVIIIPRKISGSHNKIIAKSPNPLERRESGGDIFIYKKKNMKNDNLNINKNSKNNNNNISNIRLNNKYNNIITNNKKGKIIDIDINLGKPINSINDHSPMEELMIGNNQSHLFTLDLMPNKSLNVKIKKKHKAKSGSKNKNKPPAKIKKFLEEDDDIFDYNNFYLDYNRTNSSIRKDKINNNNISSYFKFNTIENHQISFNKEKKKNNKKKQKKLFIRFNEFSFHNKKANKGNKNKRFKNLVQENDVPIFLNNNKNVSSESIKNNRKNKVNLIYINCTKFLEKIFSKLIKKKVFILILKYSDNYINENI